MSIRITFGNRGQIFNKFTKAAYKQRGEELQSLTLNQYRELCAFFFGYRSRQEISKTSITDPNSKAVAFDTLDSLTFNALVERAEDMVRDNLATSWPLSIKPPFSDLPLNNMFFWGIVTDPLYDAMTSINAHLHQYICVPIFSSNPEVLYQAIDMSDDIEGQFYELFGIEMDLLTGKSAVELISPELLNHYEYPAGFDFDDKQGDAEIQDEIEVDTALCPVLYCVELWFEAYRPIPDDCPHSLDELRNYLLNKLSIHHETNELLAVFEPVAFDRENITSPDEDGYRNYMGIYAPDHYFSLHTINQQALHPEHEKVLLMGSYEKHAGYLIFNNTTAQYFLPSADKLNLDRGEGWDDLFRIAFDGLQSFNHGFDEVVLFDVADLFEYNPTAAYTHWGMDSVAVPTGTLKNPPKRRSSHYEGTVISMPRYNEFSELDLLGSDIDMDDGVTARYMPTAAYFYQDIDSGVTPSPFMLEIAADELDDEDEITLTITKIISHYDGAYVMYIANLYDADEYLVASESFTIYDRLVSSLHNDIVGGRSCPVLKRLRDLAKSHEWKCLEVECEFEWRVCELGGMEVLAGHVPLLVEQKNTRVVALTVLTHKHAASLNAQGYNVVTEALRSALLAYTPHNAETMAPLCDIKLTSDNHTYWVKKCPYIKIDSISAGVGQTANALLHYGNTQAGVSDLHTEIPQKGPCTLYFTLTGSVSDMNEINMGFGSIMTAAMFGGGPKREVNEICKTNFPQQRSQILGAFGLVDSSDNLLVIDIFE